MSEISVRVYYEDTDAAGIVYYANYLRFLERGRTELLRNFGYNQVQLMDDGIAFAVRSLSVDYLKPARLDDVLTVATRIQSLGRAQLTFSQSIFRAQDHLLDAKIRVACIKTSNGKPTALPKPILQQLNALLRDDVTGHSA